MRRYLSSEVGPVPVSSDMCPEEQEIIQAGNAGVLSAQKETNKTKPRGKQFKWSYLDRFRLGKLAAQYKGMGNACSKQEK